MSKKLMWHINTRYLKLFVFTHLVLSGLANWYNDGFINREKDLPKESRMEENEEENE